MHYTHAVNGLLSANRIAEAEINIQSYFRIWMHIPKRTMVYRYGVCVQTRVMNVENAKLNIVATGRVYFETKLSPKASGVIM